MKKQLILDIGGVLATDFQPVFWLQLVKRYDLPIETCMQFKQNIREDLWKGTITISAFWRKLHTQFPNIVLEEEKKRLVSLIQALPALNQLKIWKEYADITLLSNHRAEWILPLIGPYMPYVKNSVISDKVGFCKPENAIFSHVHKLLPPNTSIFYVDD